MGDNQTKPLKLGHRIPCGTLYYLFVTCRTMGTVSIRNYYTVFGSDSAFQTWGFCVKCVKKEKL